MVLVAITDFNNYHPTRQMTTDQIGRIPIFSNRGNRYIMVMYDYNNSAILFELTKNKATTEIITKYTLLYDRLCRAGIKPLYQKLDNEAPVALRNVYIILTHATNWCLLAFIDTTLLKGLSRPLRITSSLISLVSTFTFQFM